MIKKLTVTILVDNHSDDSRLLAEHGLSLWIEADDRRIVFDTGQSELLIKNAETLGIDLREAEMLVLSHGHYDHIGGVEKLLELNPSLEIYCHPGIFASRYSRQLDGSVKPIGLSEGAAAAFLRCGDALHRIDRKWMLTDDIGITGTIPRVTKFEDTGGVFSFDPEGRMPDPVSDDMAMWFQTNEGITAVTGCCHSGLVNTLTYIRAITDELPFTAIIGGLHLLHASEERIRETCLYLQSVGIGKIVPCHCTGERAVDFLEQWFGPLVIEKGRIGKVGGYHITYNR